PAGISINSDQAQISISGQGVQNDRAATPSKPPNGREPSATLHRPEHPEHPVLNTNNLMENHEKH
ncbi:hypothetical protein, partial [Amycolatopsis sp. CA-126428]|uniref:hypothetical protein n=1 Tax=Amycolatopsis sp. CA-126428 TaxID=2073158 RepID=UPI001E4742A8